MAFDTDSVIIYDPLNGAATNGGGFAASRSGVRITSPIAYTDLVIGDMNTRLSSATRPFTADDRGNFICITGGTGFTPSWYEIISVWSGVATCDKVIGDLGSTGGTGNLGGYIDKFTDALMELSVPGLTHQVWATAAMVLGEDLDIAVDGVYSTYPIYIEGRASDGSDNPQGASRPTIACGAYGFAVDNFWHIEDLIFTTENANGVKLDIHGLIRNCKITNSSGTAGRRALVPGGYSVRVVDCELISTNGSALYDSETGTILYANYVHDSAVGVVVYQQAQIIANVIEACSATGLDVNGIGCFCLNNTIDTCVDGIDGGFGTVGLLALNNILSNHISEGAVWEANRRINYWDYNNFYNNGTDRTNVAAGPNDNDVDPGYTNAAGGDFSTGANVADTGFGIRMGVG